MGPRKPTPGGRTNTVGLNKRQLDALLDRLSASGETGDQRRTFARWPFREPCITLHITHPGGTDTTVRVAGRDISCGGMSVLHSAFVYPGSACTADLVAADGTIVHAQGEIVRCLHVQGLIHELGIRFVRPVDARKFIREPLPDEAFSFERVDPESLTGRVVCVEDSKLDQKLIQHYLRSSNVRLVFVEDADAAKQAVTPDCDLVVCDHQLASGTGIDVVRDIRQRLPDVPIIMLTGDEDPDLRKQAVELRVNAFLRKPVSAELLLQAMGEFLLLRQMFGNRKRKSSGGEASLKLARVLREVSAALPDLERALEDDDAMSAYAIALKIKSAAPDAGLDALARAANQAVDAVGKTMSAKQSQAQISALIDLCKRACSANAA